MHPAPPSTALPHWYFLTLGPDEEREYRQWARWNGEPEQRAKSAVYHPVIRDEWRLMDAERSAADKPL